MVILGGDAGDSLRMGEPRGRRPRGVLGDEGSCRSQTCRAEDDMGTDDILGSGLRVLRGVRLLREAVAANWRRLAVGLDGGIGCRGGRICRHSG